MPFGNIKLKMEFGGHRIIDRGSALAFLKRLSEADRKKAHWRLAERALNETLITAATEPTQACSFGDAVKAEGWLDDSTHTP